MLEGIPYHPRGKNKKEGVPALDTALLKDIPHEPRENEGRGNPEFHFEEIANIEKGITSLAEQLKSKIEAGEYDVLMSDEAGGRIPTLIFRKIFKAVNPEHEFKTLFVNGGGSIPEKNDEPEDYRKFIEYLKEKNAGTKKVLLVTQYVHTGRRTAQFADALAAAGVNYDIAAVHAMLYEPDVDFSYLREQGKVFVGTEFGDENSELHEKHEHVSGITKKGEYSPIPSRLVDAIEADGRDLSTEEWAEIFDIEPYDPDYSAKINDPTKIKEWERRVNEPLSKYEKADIQTNVRLSREDVDTMAQKVVKEVWHKDSDTIG